MAKRYLLIGPEGEYNERSTDLTRIDISGEGFAEKRPFLFLNEARAGAPSSSWEDARASSGSIDIIPSYNFVTRLMKHFAYQSEVSEVASGIFSRTFLHRPEFEPPASLSIGIDRDEDIAWRHGCVCNGIRLGVQKDKSLAFECSFEGGAEQPDSRENIDASYFTEWPIVVSSRYSTLAPTLLIDGSPASDTVGSFELEIRQARGILFDSRSLDPVAYRDDGRCTVSGSIRWSWSQRTRDRILAYYAMSNISLQLLFTGRALGDGYNESLLLKVGNAIFQGDPPNIRGAGGRLPLRSKFTAMLDSSVESPFEIRTTSIVDESGTWDNSP